MTPSREPASWKNTVARIQACATVRGRAREEACSLEGTRLFERAIRAGASIESAVTTRAFLSDPSDRIQKLLLDLRAAAVNLETVPDKVMAELTDGRAIGAILGLARLPEPQALEALARAGGLRVPFFLGLVGVDDPGNVGALVRTAHAAGASALLTVGACDPFHPVAVRTSMGSVFRLPVLARSDLGELSLELHELGVRTLGSVSSGGVDLSDLKPTGEACAVLMGSEAFGLAGEDRAAFDQLVTIPMADGVDSLSVNAAAAVLLYRIAPPLPASRKPSVSP